MASAKNVRTDYGNRARWRNQASAEKPTQAINVPVGEVRVQPKGNGWLFIQIGRASHVKRFNITEEELGLLNAAMEEVAAQRKQLSTEPYKGKA